MCPKVGNGILVSIGEPSQGSLPSQRHKGQGSLSSRRHNVTPSWKECEEPAHSSSRPPSEVHLAADSQVPRSQNLSQIPRSSCLASSRCFGAGAHRDGCEVQMSMRRTLRGEGLLVGHPCLLLIQRTTWIPYANRDRHIGLPREEVLDNIGGNLRRAFNGESENPRGNRREGDGLAPILLRHLERATIRGGQSRILGGWGTGKFRRAAIGSGRMDHMLRGQIKSLCDLRIARLDAIAVGIRRIGGARGLELRASGTMDRAVYATTAKHPPIRGIHDGIDTLLCNVGDNNLDSL